MGNNNKREKIIISVGGSLIVPDGGIATSFLINLNKFIRNQLVENPARQFFLIIGGGATARHYIEAGRDVIGHELTLDDLDWLGIHATRLNAHLIRTIFRDVAHRHIIEHYDIIRKATESVVIAAGWKPGWSTDYCATLICEDYDVNIMLNLSNVAKLYNKDPNRYKNARPIDKIDWEKFREMVGDDWIPGLNSPFDPVAAKKAQELGLQVIIMSGHDFENIENYFQKKEFIGTIIE